MRPFACFLLLLILSACGGGTVMFAPTPAPPDQSPVIYAHPSGAFTAAIPQQWARYEQNTTTLAAAAFSAPHDDQPAVLLAVVNVGREVSDDEFAQIINLYQTQVRADVGEYVEQSREPMGDGSWRLTGLRRTAGGGTQPLNTFIQRAGSLIGVIEIVVSPTHMRALEQIANSFALNATADLDPAELSALAFAKEGDLALLHVAAWTTPEGVFFITGEVANYGANTRAGLAIEATLLNADGQQIDGAVDRVMGHGVTAGGFAPFSLRFGGGQPAAAASYTLTLNSGEPTDTVIGADGLTWTDDSEFDALNRLLINGEVRNTTNAPIREVRAVVTVFDAAQDVIGAAFVEVSPVLAAGDSAEFTITLPELGGSAQNYILSVQGVD